MNKKEIDSIVYLIKEAKRKGTPKPIVFMGAGMSVSAGIPIAQDIVKSILIKHKEKPEIIALKEDEKTYVTVMNSLNANERNEILRSYINNAKINPAHVYLAQLLNEEYIDYILTVNFDNLLLRASALFNYIPPVFDVANIDSLTTTTIQKGSVTYLHGQHTGLYLLNTKDEMLKIQRHTSPFLNKICNERPWIIIGYSGEDLFLDELKKLGKFDNELFWICYKDSKPNQKVQECFFNDNNSGASLIMGYDADNFFMTLHRQLQCETPKIFSKPFSFLNNIISDVVNIDEKSAPENISSNEHQPLFLLNEMLHNVKSQLSDAINRYESTTIIDSNIINENIDASKLKQKILEIAIKQDFEKESDFIEKIKSNSDLHNELSILYTEWANHLAEEGEKKSDITLLHESIKKYELAESLNPNAKSAIYNNWGIALYKIFKITNNEEFYEKAIKKYQDSADSNPTNSSSLYNLANILSDKATAENKKELFEKAIEKYQMAYQIDPNNDFALCNWGNCLYLLFKINSDESFLLEAISKLKEAYEVNPYNKITIINWGVNLSTLAQIKKDPEIFIEAFDKYKLVLKIDPDYDKAHNIFAGALIEYYKITKDASSLENALVEAIRASKFNFTYNLSCAYALLDNKADALNNLEKSFINSETTVNKVLEDDEWDNYKKDSDFIALLNKFKIS